MADTPEETEAGAGDAPPGSLAALPLEAITLALARVGPRSVKRFGATCTNYLALARWYVTRLEYGLLLARSARLWLKNDLVRRHADCWASAADFDTRAERHTAQVAAALGGSGAVPPRSRREVLRFLYPMALAASHYWVLAPYAFEWCALSERRALSGDPGAPPRRELLALLHGDALARLAALAREAGWPLGVSYAATAAAACGTLSPESRPAVVRIARLLSCAVKAAAAGAGDPELAIWCVATDAAVDRRLAGGTCAFGCWRYVQGGPVGSWWSVTAARRRATAARRDAAFVSLVAQWRALAGLEGGDRSPRAWLAKFRCGPFEPHGDLEDEALLRNAELFARGEAPAVPELNAALAALLERAAGGGNRGEDSIESDEDALPTLLGLAARWRRSRAGHMVRGD